MKQDIDDLQRHRAPRNFCFSKEMCSSELQMSSPIHNESMLGTYSVEIVCKYDEALLKHIIYIFTYNLEYTEVSNISFRIIQNPFIHLFH